MTAADLIERELGPRVGLRTLARKIAALEIGSSTPADLDVGRWRRNLDHYRKGGTPTRPKAELLERAFGLAVGEIESYDPTQPAGDSFTRLKHLEEKQEALYARLDAVDLRLGAIEAFLESLNRSV